MDVSVLNIHYWLFNPAQISEDTLDIMMSVFVIVLAKKARFLILV